MRRKQSRDLVSQVNIWVLFGSTVVIVAEGFVIVVVKQIAEAVVLVVIELDLLLYPMYKIPPFDSGVIFLLYFQVLLAFRVSCLAFSNYFQYSFVSFIFYYISNPFKVETIELL